ncbi:MAG TPA: ABC transporter permease [Terriglobia bacterium]|nr:ABC transporter permease [Terriglobia bacterium]
MNAFMQDVRYGLRMLLKYPGATAVVVLSLALGIGANTAIFSVVNSLLFRPPAVAEPGRLVDVWLHNVKRSGFDGYYPLNFPDFAYYRDHNSVFSGLAAAGGDGMTVVWSRDGQGEALLGMLVSANYFSVLGVQPELGRTFLPEEDRPGAEPVAVVSHSFWRRHLGGDPAALGRPITLNGRACSVVGVISDSFHGVMIGAKTDVWVPMTMQPLVKPGLDLTSRNEGWLEGYGRLQPGVSLQQAHADLRVLSKQLATAYPAADKDIEALGYPATVIPGPYRGFLAIITVALMAVVGMVLLIACANAANLLLAQASRRWREMAVRAALGAGRWRLVRQALAESVLLGCLGGAAGLLLAAVAAPLLLRLVPPGIPVALQIPVDWRVLVFTLAVAVFAGVAFGLAPALRASRLDLVSSLKEGTPGSGHGKSRLRSVLVTVQVAVCLVLLVGAGLCLRSLVNAQSIDPGFDIRNVLVASLDVETFGYNEARGRLLYQNLIDRVAALPGVRSVGMADMLPLGTSERVVGITIEGSKAPAPRPGEPGPMVQSILAAPGYFRAMGIPMLHGRDFTARDTKGAPAVVIINDAMARRYWPGQDPLGRNLVIGDDDAKHRQACEVVGVVKTGKYRTLGESPQPFMYQSYWQNYVPRVRLVVRTEAEPASVMAGMRRAVQTLDPNLALYDVNTMPQLMLLPLFPAHAAGLLLGVFGGLALLLATMGLYGVMSYLVAQRTREVGIRMALGARRPDVFKLVVGNGMKLTLAGVVIGLAGALAVTRLLASLLYGIRPTDFVTFAGVSLLLAGVAFLASYLPARRATRVDPMVALRHE